MKNKFPNGYWCPYCNFKVGIPQKFCECGWEVNEAGAMASRCEKWIWEMHKTFISEYRYMKDHDMVKSGYEYFKLKVGKTELGKAFVKKIECGYPLLDDDFREIKNAVESTFPKDWHNHDEG